MYPVVCHGYHIFELPKEIGTYPETSSDVAPFQGWRLVYNPLFLPSLSGRRTWLCPSCVERYEKEYFAGGYDATVSCL